MGSPPSIWLEAVLAEAIMTPAGGSGVEPRDEGCFVDAAETWARRKPCIITETRSWAWISPPMERWI